jgi:hypothetical protein
VFPVILFGPIIAVRSSPEHIHVMLQGGREENIKTSTYIAFLITKLHLYLKTFEIIYIYRKLQKC